MNKFHDGNRTDGKHYWLTPPDVYRALDAEFHFDFDPCPHPLPPGFDGLTCEWGRSNYVNPPFGSILQEGRKKGPTAWARKAMAEHAKGKTVVLVYPQPKWVLMLLGAAVRNLGDVRWLATEDGSQGPGIGQHVAAFILIGKRQGDDNAKEPSTPEPQASPGGPSGPETWQRCASHAQADRRTDGKCCREKTVNAEPAP